MSIGFSEKTKNAEFFRRFSEKNRFFGEKGSENAHFLPRFSPILRNATSGYFNPYRRDHDGPATEIRTQPSRHRGIPAAADGPAPTAEPHPCPYTAAGADRPGPGTGRSLAGGTVSPTGSGAGPGGDAAVAGAAANRNIAGGTASPGGHTAALSAAPGRAHAAPTAYAAYAKEEVSFLLILVSHCFILSFLNFTL